MCRALPKAYLGCRSHLCRRAPPASRNEDRPLARDAPSRDVALQAVVQGFLTPVISFWLYGRAVSILGASNGSAFAALSPVMTAILAIPILGEWPATSDWIAMVLISGGVYVASGRLRSARRVELAPQPPASEPSGDSTV